MHDYRKPIQSYRFSVTSLPTGINSIIFDLGGVLINLSPERTIHAFAEISGVSNEAVKRAYASDPIFIAYEKGQITDQKFRDSIRSIFSSHVDDTEIDRCWNAMLVDFPVATLTMLKTLKNHFNTCVLSNTNTIHLKYVNDVMLLGKPLDDWFHKGYYSHLMGMRKPELEIYTHVLQDNSLIPERTIFLDDNEDNVKAAQSLGIKTIHITHHTEVINLFNGYD